MQTLPAAAALPELPQAVRTDAMLAVASSRASVRFTVVFIVGSSF